MSTCPLESIWEKQLSLQQCCWDISYSGDLNGILGAQYYRKINDFSDCTAPAHLCRFFSSCDAWVTWIPNPIPYSPLLCLRMEHSAFFPPAYSFWSICALFMMNHCLTLKLLFTCWNPSFHGWACSWSLCSVVPCWSFLSWACFFSIFSGQFHRLLVSLTFLFLFFSYFIYLN